MTVSIIGVHCNWDGQALPSAQQGRFAASLGFLSPGPAESSLWGGAVLAATGKRRGWLPQELPDGSQILFCGHIDNRGDLTQRLGIGRQSDEALYAAAYQSWGDRADLEVLGQFASIIVRPGGREIRLCRSPISAPPLFYWHDGAKLIVASLANAIFATGEVERRADRKKMVDGLFRNPQSARTTYFAGVGKVPLGHRAVVTRDSLSETAYYDLSALLPVRFADDRDYVAAGRELFEAAVRAALDGFAKPAISLSGGYDSQAVAAFVAKTRPGQPIEAFTAIDDPEWGGFASADFFTDEKPYVEALAAMYPEIRPHWIDGHGLAHDHRQAAVFAAAGAPGPSVLGLWTHEIYAGAKAAGCDVILEATLGNSTFSFGSYGVLAGLARRGQWLRLWQQAGHLGRTHGKSRVAMLAVEGFLPFAPDWLYTLLAKRFRPHLLPDPFASWCPLRRDYVARTGASDRALASGGRLADRLHASSLSARIGKLGQGADDYCETQQAFALLHGLSARDPTNYRPLVEFCLGIPDDQYLRDGKLRWLAQRMLKGLVPDQVLSESRRALRATDWHLRAGRQREAMIAEFDRLADDPEIADMFDLEALRAALVDWPDDAPGMRDDARHKYAVLNGLIAARFIRFIDGRN